MNGFIFASGVNSAGHGNDAKHVFRPGAECFKKINKIPQDIFYFDHREKDALLRKQIINKIKTMYCHDGGGLDVIAYFGHGIPRGLPSCGFYSEGHHHHPTNEVVELAHAIAGKCKPQVKIILYACSAGKLPHSFAGALASALAAKNARVFGHTCVGHSFGNPFVTVFEGSRMGRFVIGPGDPQWKAWCTAIRAGNSNNPLKHPLWAQFPFMSDHEIRHHVALGGK